MMLKDKKKYASTGGWAFQAWAGGDPKKPLVTSASAATRVVDWGRPRAGLFSF
jgi:hypothetical protein